MTVVSTVAMSVLLLAAAFALTRLLRGPTLADRMVALDQLLLIIAGGIAVNAASTGRGEFLDVMIVATLLGFIGSVTVARFIERRGV